MFILMIAFGILMISGTVYDTPTSEEIVKTEQGHDDKEQSESGLRFSIQEAVTHTVQVSVSFQSFLIVVLPELGEITFGKCDINWSPLTNAKQVKILFRMIISPNAP